MDTYYFRETFPVNHFWNLETNFFLFAKIYTPTMANFRQKWQNFYHFAFRFLFGQKSLLFLPSPNQHLRDYLPLVTDLRVPGPGV